MAWYSPITDHVSFSRECDSLFESYPYSRVFPCTPKQRNDTHVVLMKKTSLPIWGCLLPCCNLSLKHHSKTTFQFVLQIILTTICLVMHVCTYQYLLQHHDVISVHSQCFTKRFVCWMFQLHFEVVWRWIDEGCYLRHGLNTKYGVLR